MEGKKKSFEKELKNKIQQKLKAKDTEESFLTRAFKFVDIAGKGRVNFEQFSAAVARVGFPIEKAVLQELFADYDTNKDQFIDYKEFSAALFRNPGEAPKAVIQSDIRGKMLLDTLRKKLNERGAKGIMGLVRSFKLIDLDKSNTLSLDEFKNAIKTNKLAFDEPDIETIFKEMDKNNDSQIDQQEFIRALTGELNEKRLEYVMKAFNVLDINRDGVVEYDELKVKYNPSKHPSVLEGRKTEKQILEEFASTFELAAAAYGIGTKDGRITKEEFIEYYTNISASIDSDEYFVVMMTNSWNLEATLAGGKIEGKSTEEFPKKKPNKDEQVEFTKFNSESKVSPLKKTVAESSAEQPLVKEIRVVPVEAPYYQEEEEKKTGNILPDFKLAQKTDYIVLERFRSAVLARGIKGILGLERQFKVYTKTTLIDLENYKKAIEDFRLAIDPKDVAVLFTAFDKDADNKVSYEELIKAIIGDLNPRRKQYVEIAFKVIDKDNNGIINSDDFARAFEGWKHPDVKQGKKRQEDLLHETLELLDMCSALHKTTPTEGIYTLAEFIVYYTYSSACIESDVAFEQLMGYLWKIDALPKPAVEEQAYAGSQQKVFQLSGKETYYNDIHGSMANESHPMRGTNKFEWDAPPYTVFDRLEEQKAQAAAGAPSFGEYKRKEEAMTEQPDMTNTELLDYIKYMLGKRGATAIILLHRLLKRADVSNSGTLSKEQFEECLNKIGIKLIKRNMDKTFKLFDLGNTGVLSQEEFVKTIIGEMSLARAQLVEQVFIKLDQDKNGYIDDTDIIAIYSAKGHPEVVSKKKSEKQMLAQFLDIFELYFSLKKPTSKDQRITMEEFKEYYSYISCLIEKDDTFEQMLRSSWKLEPKA